MIRRTTLELCTLVGCLVFGLLTVIGQEDTAPNWCYEGEPWGDGRCNTQPTDADNQNYWVCGYWNAKVDNADITLTELETIAPQCTSGYFTVRFPQTVSTSDSSDSNEPSISADDTPITEPEPEATPTPTDDAPVV